MAGYTFEPMPCHPLHLAKQPPDWQYSHRQCVRPSGLCRQQGCSACRKPTKQPYRGRVDGYNCGYHIFDCGCFGFERSGYGKCVRCGDRVCQHGCHECELLAPCGGFTSHRCRQQRLFEQRQFLANTNDDITTDLAGRPRILDGTVDIGAYESGLQATQTIMFTTPTAMQVPQARKLRLRPRRVLAWMSRL